MPKRDFLSLKARSTMWQIGVKCMLRQTFKSMKCSLMVVGGLCLQNVLGKVPLISRE